MMVLWYVSLIGIRDYGKCLFDKGYPNELSAVVEEVISDDDVDLGVADVGARGLGLLSSHGSGKSVRDLFK